MLDSQCIMHTSQPTRQPGSAPRSCCGWAPTHECSPVALQHGPALDRLLTPVLCAVCVPPTGPLLWYQ